MERASQTWAKVFSALFQLVNSVIHSGQIFLFETLQPLSYWVFTPAVSVIIKRPRHNYNNNLIFYGTTLQ